MRMSFEVMNKSLVAAGVAAILAVLTAAPVAFADECDALSCQDVCRSDRVACSAMRKTLADWLKAFCKMDLLDVRFDCVDAKTQSDEDCSPLCGDEYAVCKDASAAAYRDCLNIARPGEVSCKADMRAELADA